MNAPVAKANDFEPYHSNSLNIGYDNHVNSQENYYITRCKNEIKRFRINRFRILAINDLKEIILWKSILCQEINIRMLNWAFHKHKVYVHDKVYAIYVS